MGQLNLPLTGLVYIDASGSPLDLKLATCTTLIS